MVDGFFHQYFPQPPRAPPLKGKPLAAGSGKKTKLSELWLGGGGPPHRPITWAPMTPGLGSRVSSASWTPLPGVLGPYNSHPTPPALRLGLNAR